MPAPLAIEPTDIRLIAEPLDYLEAEHHRQRVFLAHVERLNAGALRQGRTRLAKLLLAFLRSDLFLHVADEEENLIPLLRRRCSARRLSACWLPAINTERAKFRALCATVEAELSHAVAVRHAAPWHSVATAAFVKSLRRSVILENAYLLPLARECLLPTDRAAMSKAFAARRGLRSGHGKRRSGYLGG